MQVPALDPAFLDLAYTRLGAAGRPPGALGKVEGLGVWLAGAQGACPPRPLVRRRLVVFAGDHGLGALGATAYGPDATDVMIADLRSGTAAAAVLARLHDVTVRVEDLGASAPISAGPAVSLDVAQAAYERGLAVADAEVDGGADVLLAGDVGAGSTTAAAALVCALTDAEPHEAVGRGGSGVDDAGWTRKVAVVRDALRRSAFRDLAPVELLAELGGADLAALAGFVLGGARRRTPVVLDGVVTAAAALVAARVAPGAAAFLVASHSSPGEPAHAKALAALGLEPLQSLGIRSGGGSAAVLALPLLDAGIALLRED
jgi:nicotinate-nucleotide--dimethylbenzimidazole phosphoribosyltransferase